MDNKYWVQKADLVVQDFITDGGYMNAEQTSALFSIPIKTSVLLSKMTVKPMKSSQLELSKLGFTGRILRGAVENQALTANERSKPVSGKTVLDVEEFIASVRIPYGALEDHVTQNTLMSHIRREMGVALRRDMEFVALQGDTTSSDFLLAKLDGLIKQVTTNTVALGGGTPLRLTRGQLKQIRQTIPTELKSGARDMQYWTSDNAALDYGDSLASRGTALGDQHVQSLDDLKYAGSDVVSVPEFPDQLGSGTDETLVVYANPKNAHMGVQRQVMIETEKDIDARQWKVVATIKMDFKWAHEPATIKGTEVLSTPSA